MDGYEQHRSKLESLGARIAAASVDVGEDAKKVAAGVGFPVLQGVNRELADRIGAWWEEKRGIIQPSEFLLDAEGKVMAATYSTGPIGRIAAQDAVSLIEFYESKK